MEQKYLFQGTIQPHSERGRIAGGRYKKDCQPYVIKSFIDTVTVPTVVVVVVVTTITTAAVAAIITTVV